MATPTAIAAYAFLFAMTGFLFLFVNMLIGWLVRPRLPNPEKQEVYECGEPTIGTSFVQFDLRFYVVALLFIIFDVEIAFFFPWGTVFGKATQLAAEGTPIMATDLDPEAPAERLAPFAENQLRELGFRNPTAHDESLPLTGEAIRASARRLAITSIVDIGVFFGVLLVGFAYVWKRGDLDWVRAVTRQRTVPLHRVPPPRALEPSQSILSA